MRRIHRRYVVGRMHMNFFNRIRSVWIQKPQTPIANPSFYKQLVPDVFSVTQSQGAIDCMANAMGSR